MRPGWSALVGVLLAAAAGASQAQALGNDLTLAKLQASFAAKAKADGDATVRISTCRDNQAAQSTRRAYSCQVGEAGFLDGVMEPNSVLRDISVTYIAGSQADVHDFQRAAKYLVATAAGTDAKRPQVAMITDLMHRALQAPGRSIERVDGGLRYTVTYTAADRAPKWRMAAEPTR